MMPGMNCQAPASPPDPPTINIIEDELLDDRDVSALLSVSRATATRYRRTGKLGVRLPSAWQGRRKVTTRACLEWWLSEVDRKYKEQEDR